MAALQYTDIPGYAGILFRKTLSELKLPSSLLDRAHTWLNGKNCLYVAGEHTYYFPTKNPDNTPGDPSKLTFGYIGNGTARERYQSAEFQFCVAKTEQVVMADSTTKPISKVQTGDYIVTPNGPRLVTKVHGPRLKACVEIGGRLQGLHHRILTARGWESYANQIASLCRTEPSEPKLSHAVHKLPWRIGTTLRSFWRTHETLHSGLWQPSEVVSKAHASTSYGKAIFAVLEDAENDSVGSAHVLRELSRLPQLFFLAKRPSLEPHQSWRETLQGDVPVDESSELSKLSSRGDYRLSHRSHDEQPRYELRAFQSYLPEQDDAGTSTHIYDTLDATGRTPSRNPDGSISYSHPYTMVERSSVFGADQLLSTGPFSFSEVYDLTIEGESQYVTSSKQGQLVCNSNCGFDELTHHTESDYTWMFSRLRKVVCPKHPQIDPITKAPIYQDDCAFCQQRKSLPERMRAASNPGSSGHKWVQNRFGIAPVQIKGEVFYIGTNPDRPYIPATLDDNLFVDQQSYSESLDQLDPLTRAQLRKGDWGASLDARFKAEWFANRRYTRRSEYYVLGPNSKGILLSDLQRVFSVLDPAASGREGPGDMDRYKKMDKSYTVIMTFGLTEDYNLIVLDVTRVYVEAPDIIKHVKATFKKWRPQYMICEASGVGKAVYQAINRTGLPVRAVHPHADKLNRATDALIRAEKGQIWLPSPPGPPWLKTLEDELFTWTAHPYETDDQIDCLSYGASDVSWEAAGHEATEDDEVQDVLEMMDSGISIVSEPFPGGSGTGSDYYRFI